MSGSSDGFVDYILDCLSPLGNISHARLFGGIGLKDGSVQFAIIMTDTLFFVVDDSSRRKYEDLGMECFSYNTKKKKVNIRKYYEVPVEIIEDQEALISWAKESILIANQLKK